MNYTIFCGGKNFVWNWSPPRGRSEGILVALKMTCWMWYKWRLEFTLLACWCFDKIAKSRWNLIDVYGDAQIDGKVAFLA